MSHSASQADRSRPLQTPGTEVPSKRRTSSPPVKSLPGSEVKPIAVEPEASSPSTTPSSKVEASVGDGASTSDEGDDDTPLEIIDKEIFEQILELDDDDPEKDFSYGMTSAYLVQAEETFGNMDKALSAKDLAELSRLGHYLKGSSAAIGIWRVQALCEKIQHYGQQRDDDAGGVTLSTADALSKVTQMIAQAKKENAAAEAWLKEFYKKETAEEET